MRGRFAKRRRTFENTENITFSFRESQFGCWQRKTQLFAINDGVAK